MSTERRVRCNQCDRLLDEAAGTLPAGRQPCPSCGLLSRKFEVHIMETVTVDDGFALKHKRPGLKRPVHEQVNRPEVFRKTGEVRRVERMIDRSDPDPENWRYREKITEETGEVMREVDEPLKDHTGRGTAKRGHK